MIKDIIQGGTSLKIDENSMIPIYVQIADSIEDDILSGKLKEVMILA